MSKIEEKWLASVLGEWYGGPVLSFENGVFTLQAWGDAPVCNTILAQGETIKRLMENYE